MHPFAFKKLFLLVVAFLCVSSALCFGDPLFMTRQYAPDQHRNTRVSSHVAEISASARLVSVDRYVGVSASLEGVWADVPQIGTALTDTGAGESSNSPTTDCLMAWRTVDTEKDFGCTLAERRILLF